MIEINISKDTPVFIQKSLCHKFNLTGFDNLVHSRIKLKEHNIITRITRLPSNIFLAMFDQTTTIISINEKYRMKSLGLVTSILINQIFGAIIYKNDGNHNFVVKIISYEICFLAVPFPSAKMSYETLIWRSIIECYPPIG